MLTAPTYLTGVSEELLALLRDEAANRAQPERHAKLEAVRKTGECGPTGCLGGIRYMERETG